jgi:hypothetical protein
MSRSSRPRKRNPNRFFSSRTKSTVPGLSQEELTKLQTRIDQIKASPELREPPRLNGTHNLQLKRVEPSQHPGGFDRLAVWLPCLSAPRTVVASLEGIPSRLARCFTIAQPSKLK